MQVLLEAIAFRLTIKAILRSICLLLRAEAAELNRFSPGSFSLSKVARRA